MYTTHFAQLPIVLRYRNTLRKHVNSEHIPGSIKRIYFESGTHNVLPTQHHPEVVQAHSETIVTEVLPPSQVTVLTNGTAASMSSVVQEAIFPVIELSLPRATATHRSTSSSFITKMSDIIKARIYQMGTRWQYVFGDNLAHSIRITDQGGHLHTSILFY